MNAIEVMNNEHENISRMLKIVRICCFKVLKDEEVNYEDFDKMLEFIVEYADKHHHRKEEDILFDKMVKHLGGTAEKVVKTGMLVEHDLGRLYIKDFSRALENVKNGNEESKLDLIANAISYTHLLERHIDKEDRVIYKYAERELESSILDLVNEECIEFELKNNDIKEKSIDILEELEREYIEEV
ncbi:hemerythrin domain-containing protein [Clostridium sp. NSJ-6]|uniref:Hemerythrin domain-containing protein n=1 Tax=Clostridium hominis TaxID=2763036 RepID=A0ABR7D934_9CLOT|nr:hemerythrin domain-containing protein [Clostridium hominis]MBC5627832.1 hemerythrin domain-containing protein [Clostridium hominis]MDU2672899.1 hemerythrin domain-containing protein [Clostridium sp.]